MATALAERRENPLTVIRQNLSAMAPEFKAALPAHVTVERFTRVAQTAIQNNQDLLNVDRRSLFGAIVRLAQDGLLPDGREAAIVKFGDKAQAMPMIAGILKKVRQSGEVAYVSAQVVHEKDHFVWKLGFEESVEHAPPPLDQPRGKAIGAYATAVLKDGSRLLEVMSLEEIEKVRSVSRSKGAGPWAQWWGEMARKTVMRRLSKRLPMSSDLEDGFDRDETMGGRDAEPAAAPPIDVAPMSRLDALEQRIAPQIVEDAEHEPANDGTLSPDNPAAAEGAGDEERGEAHTISPDEMIAHINRKETVIDVNSVVALWADAIAGFDDDDRELVAKAQAARIEALKAKGRERAAS